MDIIALPEALAVWDRVEEVLAREAPPIVASMLAGAQLEEIKAAEATFGQQLPPFVRAAYLRHNGQRYNGVDSDEFLMPFAEWLPLESVIDTWKMFVELEVEFAESMTPSEQRDSLLVSKSVIQKVPFHKGHIPIGSTGAASYFYVDLAPGGLGVRGQVFHGAADDYFPREIEADSFQTYMLALADHLERGSLVYDRERGLVNAANNERIVRLPPTLAP
jgi:cell wall assembly regulator SMI1